VGSCRWLSIAGSTAVVAISEKTIERLCGLAADTCSRRSEECTCYLASGEATVVGEMEEYRDVYVCMELSI
jgi:hypothetical protein